MTGEFLFYWAVAVLLGVYVCFQRQRAIKAKWALAEDLDAYLADESVPEPFKRLAFEAFEDVLKPHLCLLASWNFISNGNGEGTVIEEMKAEYGKEEFERMESMLKRILFINFRMVPILYIILSIFVVAYVLVKALAKAPSLSSLANRAERSWYKTIHFH